MYLWVKSSLLLTILAMLFSDSFGQNFLKLHKSESKEQNLVEQRERATWDYFYGTFWDKVIKL